MPDSVAAPPQDMSGTNGKVALTSTSVPLSGICPTADVIDFVGYGSANCFEGLAAAPALSNTTAAVRRNNGCADDGINSTDLRALTPSPRNSATANNLLCACTVNETNTGNEADFCRLQHPPSTSTTAGVATELIFGRLFETGVTEAAGANPIVRAQIGYGPITSNPQNQSGWVWANGSYNLQLGNDDEYQLAVTAPLSGGYRYTARFSLDGINWTYCDINGAGSNSGLTFELTQLGVLTVAP